MKLFELRQLIAAKKKELRAIASKIETENRDATEAEVTDAAKLRADIDALMARVETLEKMDADEDEPEEPAPAPERAGKPAATSTRAVTPAKAPAVHTRKHVYSLMRAIRGMSDKHNPRFDGMEKEWSDEMAIRSGKKPEGFYMPHHFGNPEAAEKRALSLTTGAGAIPTITEASMIEYLYNRAMLMQAGATVLTDMHNKFSLPRLSTTSTAQWVTEGNAPAGSNETLDQVPFTPQTIASFVDLTRKFIMQDSTDAEGMVRADIAKQIALGIDAAGLVGSGTGPTPLGLFNNTNVPVISLGANSGPPTLNAIIKMETSVAAANADLGKLAYMTSAPGRGSLKTTVKNAAAGYPVYLCEDNEVNGYPLHCTNQIPSTFTQGSGTGLTGMVFGNFADLVIALFGATDILVDPFTGSSSGTVRIAAFQDADIHNRHDLSFANLIFNPN